MNNEPLTTNQQEWLEIGTIVAAQGLKGEMRVYPDTDFPERFLVPGIRWLQHPQTGKIETKKLLAGRYLPGKNLYVISLENINYRDQAAALKDYKLLVPNSDRPQLAADEFHVADLINLEVFNQQTGESIGIVTEVYSAGNDLLEVTLHQQQETTIEEEKSDLSQISRRSKRKKYKLKEEKKASILIPFVTEIVPIVDLQNNRLEINPPEGLV